MDSMPFTSWVTRMAYRQLDRQYKLVGLKQVTEKRIALDLARQSAMPGLMRIVVSPPIQVGPSRRSESDTATGRTSSQTSLQLPRAADSGKSI